MLQIMSRGAARNPSQCGATFFAYDAAHCRRRSARHRIDSGRPCRGVIRHASCSVTAVVMPDYSHAPLANGPWLIVVAASAGGIQAIRTLLAALPRSLPAAVVLVQHRTPGHDQALAQVLGRGSAWPVTVATQGEAIEAGRAYLARADRHLTVTSDRTFSYHDGTKIRFTRSSANPLFESAARVFDGHVIAVVLTGGGRDATDGVQEVKAFRGLIIAQDEASSAHWHMPRSAIASGAVDYVLPLVAIAPAIQRVVRGEAALPIVASG